MTAAIEAARERPMPRRWFAADMTPQEAAWVAMVYWMTLFLPLAPMGQQFSPFATMGPPFIAFLSRNLRLSAATMLIGTLLLRLKFQLIKPGLETAAQAVELAGRLEVHWLYGPGAESAHPPLGALLGASSFGLGLDGYQSLWHLLAMAGPFLGFACAPTPGSLAVAVAVSRVFPLWLLTNSGSPHEVVASIAFLIVMLARGGAWLETALLGGLLALISRPMLLLLPFLAISFRRAGSPDALPALFAPSLVAALLYFAPAPLASMKQVWFPPAVSVTGLAAAFGATAVLAFLAARSRRLDTILCLGILATMTGHRIGATNYFFWELLITAIPLFAFFLPARPASRPELWTARFIAALFALLLVGPVAIRLIQ